VGLYSQDCAINVLDVIPLRERLQREMPGRMPLISDGAPVDHRYTIKIVLATSYLINR
jgi:hypothetical protein